MKTTLLRKHLKLILDELALTKTAVIDDNIMNGLIARLKLAWEQNQGR